MPSIEEVAKWGREWQVGNWRNHSVDAARAERLVTAYIELIGRKPRNGLDIGAGAGHITAALARRGIAMTASEWSDEGLALISGENPQLAQRRIDVMSFDDRGEWDLILCRELYPFTRVSDFAAQSEILSRLIAALAPHGVLVLVGSDGSRPHCADYRRLVRTAKGVSVRGPYLEAVILRLPKVGSTLRWLANLGGEIVFRFLPGLARIRVLVFCRDA